MIPPNNTGSHGDTAKSSDFRPVPRLPGVEVNADGDFRHAVWHEPIKPTRNGNSLRIDRAFGGQRIVQSAGAAVLEAFGREQPSPSHVARPVNGDWSDLRLVNLQWVFSPRHESRAASSRERRKARELVRIAESVLPQLVARGLGVEEAVQHAFEHARAFAAAVAALRRERAR